jgi:hypothetical protein
MYSENLSTAQDRQLIGTSLFEKRTVVELTENAMTEIDGGSVPTAHIVPVVMATKAIYDAIHDFWN